MQHQPIRIRPPPGTQRPRDRRRDAAAHRTRRHHLHQHETREHQRHAGKGIRPQPPHERHLDQPGRGLSHHHQYMRPSQP